MKFDKVGVPVFGDKSWRGDCPREDDDQKTFIKWLRDEYPDTWGKLAIHPENEGNLRSMGRSKAMGLSKSSSDVIIPAKTPFICELKRRDHTKSKLPDGQAEWLTLAQDHGAFACMALGWEAMKEAFLFWLRTTQQ